MRHSFAVVAILFSGAVAVGQSYVTSPPGMLSVEGTRRSTHFMAGREYRVQLVDGERRGNAMSVREVAFRHDSSNLEPDVGRRWNLVTLDVSNGSVAKTWVIFANNPTSTPTRVFAASVSLPSRRGYYGPRPEPNWLAFPFRTAWSYTGKEDICLDFTFQNGTLANNATWPRIQWFEYGFSSYQYGQISSSDQTYYGNFAATSECVDPTSSRPLATQPGLLITHWSWQYPDRYLKNRVEVQVRAFHTRAYTNVMFALGFAGVNAGLPTPGVVCNRLHVDVRQPTLYFGLPSYGLGNTGVAYPFGRPVYSSSFARIPLWTQCAFVHSKTGKLVLSAASRALVPEPPQYRPRVAAFGDRSQTRGWTSSDTAWNPMIRYSK